MEYEQAIDEAQKSVETSEELGLEQEARVTNMVPFTLNDSSSYTLFEVNRSGEIFFREK